MMLTLIDAVNQKDLLLLETLLDDQIAYKIPSMDSLFDKAVVINNLFELDFIKLNHYEPFLYYHVLEIEYNEKSFIAKIKIKKDKITQIYVEEKLHSKRLLVRYSYNGALFYGSQRQPFKRTVTGVLETVLSQYLNHSCELIPASRTDRFVHAMDQVAHVDTTSSIPIDTLKTIMNQALDDDIKIHSIEEVPQVFHARFDVLKKTYVYKFVHERNPSFAHLATYHKSFDLNKLREKMSLFEGKHDFKSFSKSSLDEITIRTIYRVLVHTEGPHTLITIEGNGFLRYMIRMMIGQVLYDLDYNKDTIKKYLDNPSHDQAIHIVSGKGLYLNEITYE
jgi:tRNA pseudouridine38-40 synthase